MRREAEYFSMTTGIWISRTLNSYMVITMHYLTKAFTMKDVTLKAAPLRGSQTGDYIEESGGASFAEFRLKKDTLSKVMRNSASNGVKACNAWNIPDLCCIAHCTNLVVGSFFLGKWAKWLRQGSWYWWWRKRWYHVVRECRLSRQLCMERRRRAQYSCPKACSKDANDF